jgi:hypothetical protein
MSSAVVFRRRLASCLMGAVGATSLVAGCDADVSSDLGGQGGNANPTTTGAVEPTTTTTTTTGMNPCWPAAGGEDSIQCFAWPQPLPSTGSSTGIGGSGGSVSIGSGGAAGGAPGMGGAGGAGVPPCPGIEDAGLLIYNGACGYTLTGPGGYANGECCYPATTMCCSGRPFLADGRVRTAATRRGAGRGAAAGWTAPLRPRVESLDLSTRAFLADAWLGDALLEHASVASFARFALELLAVGAPSDLVDAAHAAARDEVAHARACFALASAYAGAELAPARFDFGGKVEVSSDLAAIAASAVKEGCVGETLAAMQAAEQLAAATDPAVREALAVIAADEARHAELAYRFVAWAIETGGESVRLAVAGAFVAALVAPVAPAAVPQISGDVAEHGGADAAVLRAAFDATITEAILPAARSLARGGVARDAA